MKSERQDTWGGEVKTNLVKKTKRDDWCDSRLKSKKDIITYVDKPSHVLG